MDNLFREDLIRTLVFRRDDQGNLKTRVRETALFILTILKSARLFLFLSNSLLSLLMLLLDLL